jgi:hypothetical protein
VRPFTAASSGCSPRWKWRSMFSKTTVESSTRIPITSVIPSSEIVSSVMFIIFMRNIAIESEVGIATQTTTAFRHERRKKIITSAVRPIPSARVLMTPWICWSVKIDSVCVTLKFTSGKRLRSIGSCAITASEAVTSEASAVFWMFSRMAFWPSICA